MCFFVHRFCWICKWSKCKAINSCKKVRIWVGRLHIKFFEVKFQPLIHKCHDSRALNFFHFKPLVKKLLLNFRVFEQLFSWKVPCIKFRKSLWSHIYMNAFSKISSTLVFNAYFIHTIVICHWLIWIKQNLRLCKKCLKFEA
jgi:hypothetical protein